MNAWKVSWRNAWSNTKGNPGEIARGISRRNLLVIVGEVPGIIAVEMPGGIPGAFTGGILYKSLKKSLDKFLEESSSIQSKCAKSIS